MDDYSEDQMNLRQQALLVLFKHFGKGDYSNTSIYECADDWVKSNILHQDLSNTMKHTILRMLNSI